MKKIPGSMEPYRHETYDWAKILDGTQWELTKGVDFSTEVKTFRVCAYNAALRHNKKISTRIVDDKSIRLQARDR